MKDSSIFAKNLIVDRARTRVLDDLTFTIRPGSITGLIGPSGSGKTTLMRAIVGVQAIGSGRLLMF